MLLHVPTGTYLKLDSSAAMVVELLRVTGDPQAAASRLAADVSIPLSRATADVGTVVSALERLRRGGARRGRRPSAAGAARELARWWRLAPGLRLACVRVAVLLVVVEAGLRTLDVARLAAALGTPLAPAGDPAAVLRDDGALDARERRDLAALEWVGRRWLYPVTCLRLALVTGRLLRRRDPVLRLGLMDDGTTAHAWVEAQGARYGAQDVAGVFQPLP